MTPGSYSRSALAREGNVAKAQLAVEPKGTQAWNDLSMVYQLLRELATAAGDRATIKLED